MTIEKALSKLQSAQMCHPNAVQHLITEAIENLQALAQQAQEPVANERDCPHCNYTGSMHCGDVAEKYGGILNPKDCSHAKLFGSRATTPQPQPAPPVPAPVDERADFEAWYSDHATKHNAHGLTFTVEDITELREADHYGEHRTYLNNLWEGWQARAALQSPAPQTKGQP